MPRNDKVNLAPGVWALLTVSDVTAVRVVALAGYDVLLMATNGTTAPSDIDGGVPLPAGQILAADMPLSALFPGVAGANRLWAFCNQNVSLSVSHV
jgi:hypothetical protein